MKCCDKCSSTDEEEEDKKGVGCGNPKSIPYERMPCAKDSDRKADFPVSGYIGSDPCEKQDGQQTRRYGGVSDEKDRIGHLRTEYDCGLLQRFPCREYVSVNDGVEPGACFLIDHFSPGALQKETDEVFPELRLVEEAALLCFPPKIFEVFWQRKPFPIVVSAMRIELGIQDPGNLVNGEGYFRD